ncbi:MAG: flavodoxin family protein [Spirochaetes bacterium]|nr:flavodoxin family protein [Spirochaetota bacterium]
MSDTVLVIHGSPRKNGSSSALAKAAVEGIREGGSPVAIEEYCLHTMEIRPCSACDACRRGAQRFCVIDDDMAPLYERIERCSALVIASPIYWFSVSAQLKLFMDRLYGLNVETTGSLRGKKVGILLTYGDVDPYRSGAVNAIRTLEDAFSYTGSVIRGIVYGTGRDEGAEAGLLARAKELGRGLL